ncbi:MAG: hypothetical protein J6A89_07735 [Clostridia bacterium]|nr:hypothetical protein [Clostridia bacterium]
MEIKELDKDLIHRANYNSMSGKRGDSSAQSYKSYVDEVMGWDISEAKKQKILDKLHEKYSEILENEANHVSVLVAGPARYNAKRLDKSDKILQLSHEFCEWLNDLRKQVKDSKTDTTSRDIDVAIRMINFCVERGFDPKDSLIKLVRLDNQKFIELYEKYQPIYKWRKNTNIFKLYAASLNGEIQEIKKEIIYEDENFTAYIEGDRAYIRFTMKIQRQLIVALKSRKWWWNSNKKAWSTYLERVDKDWIKSISERYSSYI